MVIKAQAIIKDEAYETVYRILAEDYDMDTVMDFQIENVSIYLKDYENLYFRNLEYATQDVIDMLVDRVNVLYRFAEYYRIDVPIGNK